MVLSGDGEPSRRVRLGERASAAPVTGDGGDVFVPCDSGDLVVVHADGAQRVIAIGSTPLHAPVFDAKRRRLLLSAGDGTVAAIALPD
jgi:hypothetical protein